jgi:2-isopropylmalate synthase
LIRPSIYTARRFTDDVEWSAEDATRSDLDFLCRCVEEAIDAGARTINIPDTVGYATPHEYGALIATLLRRVPNIDRAVLSTHCHDDLGCATANSLAGVRAGARQVECTILGIGERAGNASLEEVVMGLVVRPDQYSGLATGIITTLLTPTAALVARTIGRPIPNNKAIVGGNAFRHESGIHQHGIQKDVRTYEIMTPESVGAQSTQLVLGKHSGRHAFAVRMQELGYVLEKKELEGAFERFKELGDRMKEIGDGDLIALMDEAMATAHDRIQLLALEVQSGTRGAHASVTFAIDATEVRAESAGDGPVDAAFVAIRRALHDRIPQTVRLATFSTMSVAPGSEAQGSVRLSVQVNGATFGSTATHTDTVVAAVTAYLRALGKALAYLESGRGNEPFPGSRPVV